jgi:hypothetical protein
VVVHHNEGVLSADDCHIKQRTENVAIQGFVSSSLLLELDITKALEAQNMHLLNFWWR